MADEREIGGRESEEVCPAPGRREAIQALAGGLAATVAVAAATALSAPPTEPAPRNGRGIQYGMVIDVRRCIGCHACTVACKSEFDVPVGENRSWVEYVEKGEYPYVGRSFLPRLCNHCSIPPCVYVCPTNATYKRPQDGAVVVDVGLCIGCKYCIQACPYEARFLNPITGAADKCDFCLHRVSKGVAPACVSTCVGGARIFGDVSDPESEISKLIASERVTVLRGEMGTLPNVYYIAADHTDSIDARRPEVRQVEVDNHRRRKHWR
ncbi:MAG: 4Fe-4S dicluster domain-containing protein [Proteobacteria bacterium]|nr:4Fe-4S dicluster domain-containing protein [Pseudomonadota bacterium]